MSTEVKDRIVKGALELFLLQGIKSVTMDKIAASLTISKRTIYEHFEDKERLLLECLTLLKNYNDKQRIRMRKESDCAVLYMVDVFLFFTDFLGRINPNFFVDIKTYAPEAFEKTKQEKQNQITEFVQLMAEAQAEGDVIPTYSPEVLGDIFYKMMYEIDKMCEIEGKRESQTRLISTFYNVFFRGIVTEEGYKKLEKKKDFMEMLTK